MSELDELHNLQRFVTSASGVFPRFSRLFDADHEANYYFDENPNQRIALKSSMPGTDTANKALYVMCWGSFEQFLRMLVREGAQLRNRIGWSNGEIPLNVRTKHTIICAQLMPQIISGSLRITSLNGKMVSKNLHEIYCQADQAKLDVDALSAFGGGFAEDELEKLGERIGVTLSWTAIGDCSELRSLSELKGKDAVGKWASGRFCKARDDRNLFTHRGAGPEVFGQSEFEEHFVFLKVLATRAATMVGSQSSDEK